MKKDLGLDLKTLRRAEVFEGLDGDQMERLMAIARPCHIHKGAYLFLLGDHADRLYVVLRGKAELAFPMSVGGVMRDIPVEVKLPGSALGWSALVKPYRFTLSARAVEPCDFAGFQRPDLLRVFEEDFGIGYVFMKRIAEVIGRRLLQEQALWARQVQRAIAGSLESMPYKSGFEPGSVDGPGCQDSRRENRSD